MSSAAAAPSWYTWFKLAVFALLACNAAVFSVAGTPSEGIDAIAWLWILVVLLLEAKVRFTRAVRERRTEFKVAAGMLYGALALFVPVWAWRGEWFDAWDAAPWLVAFVAIEINVLSEAPGRATR